jgi:hypothetical protein
MLFARLSIGKAIAQYLSDLETGDPIAIGLTAAVLLVVLPVALFAVKVHFDMKKEDTAKNKGRKSKK